MNTVEFLPEMLTEFLCLLHPLCNIHLRKEGLRRSRCVLTANYHIDGIAFFINLDIYSWSQLRIIKNPLRPSSRPPSMGEAFIGRIWNRGRELSDLLVYGFENERVGRDSRNSLTSLFDISSR
jgi:hypothetical protein